MQLSRGEWVEFEQHGSHRELPAHTIHILRIWRSKAEKDAGNPGVRWDIIMHWNGPQDPGPRLLRHLNEHVAPFAFTEPAAGRSHCNQRSLELISDSPDIHGILSHPSMGAFKASGT